MKRHSKLYIKIISGFLVLTFLFFTVIAFHYLRFASQQKHDFEAQIRSNILSIHEQFQQYVYNIIATNNLFFSLPFVQQGIDINNKSLENKLAAEDVVQILSYCNNTLGVNIVLGIFTYCDEQRVFSRYGVSSSESFFKNIYSFEKYDHDQWMELLDRRAGTIVLDATMVTFSQSTQQSVLPIVNTSYSNGNLCVFVSICSVNALAKQYEKTAVLNDSVYIVLSDSGEVIYDRDNLLSQTEFSPQDTQCTINGTDYNVITEEFSPFLWRVVCLTPTSLWNPAVWI